MPGGDTPTGTGATGRPPLADLHCHYPMHVLAGAHDDPPEVAFDQLVKVRRRSGFGERLRAAVVLIAAKLFNHRRFYDEFRVDLDNLHEADVRIVLSVVYSPFAELDLDKLGETDPEEIAFEWLEKQIEAVERDLAGHDPERAKHRLIASGADLDESAVREDRRVGFVHAVEGGFHIGRDLGKIPSRVAKLAEMGVAYITVAHLFYRRVATNTPALPIPDRLYDFLFRQPERTEDGLTERGEALVDAMYEHGILIDISHMRRNALDETFARLKELDDASGRAPGDYPVIATHAGYRFKDKAYMLDRDTIEELKRRDGVIGLIMGRRLLGHGLPYSLDSFDRSYRAVRDHIDAIDAVPGTPHGDRSHMHVAIGSDLDGFIKPTAGEIETPLDLGRMRDELARDLPESAADVCNGNAQRVLRRMFSLRASRGSGG